MKLNAERLRDGSQWLIRELTRLSQLNRPLTLDEFYQFSENEIFIHKLFEKYGEFIRALDNLNPSKNTHDAELLEYMENAFSRHANAISPNSYGVVDDAYLLAINVTASIGREADDL
ncbi:hypothetical protein ACILPN_20330 [Yersinia wautersii]|uniref:Uncharacterized protein n=1 Tax=Yersinia pseudotuberculosis TaxID=633 RepID=A0A380QBC2_YERPU|nr:hypothetical protein [Yersinia pseudotuberculosis]SUP84850.1 Uncharacterised protein [Yersinia pseudotuberculosis]